MSYKKLVILISVATCFLSASGQTQQGYVKTKGRLGNNGTVIAGTRLQGATVLVKGGNAVVSGNDGKFSLAIPTNSFYLQNVQKQGYVLTDPEVLSKQYVYSKNPLVLVLEDKDQQMADRRAIERKISSSLYAQLQKRNDELEALKEQHKITEEKYRELLLKLNSDQDDNEKLISEMAERYSKMDFDEVDEFNRQISSLILDGKLTEADSLLNTKGDITSRAATLRQHQEANAQVEQEIKKKQKKLDKSKLLAHKELQDLAQDCYSKFEIFKMQHQNDSAAYYIELRARLDTLNVEWQLNAGDFIVVYFVNYEKAISYYQRALNNSIIKKGLMHHDVSTCYNNLGYIYSDQGKYEEALNYYIRSLEIDKELLGDNHQEVATSYSNIGVLYSEQELYDSALVYYEKSLDIRKSLYGENAVETAVSYNNIGTVYLFQEEYDKALFYFEKVLSIRLESYGESHPDVALAYNNLGSLYNKKHDIDKSIEFHKKALSIWTLIYGEKHPDVALAYNNLGFRYWSKKDYKQAMECLNVSLRIRQEILGNINPSTGTSYNNIGGLYETMGNYIKAEEFVKKGLQIRIAIYGDNHADVAASYSNLAGIYLALSNYHRAIENLNKALEIIIKISGEKHPAVARIYSNIGKVYEQEGKYIDAEKYYSNAYKILLENYTADDKRVIREQQKIEDMREKIK